MCIGFVFFLIPSFILTIFSQVIDGLRIGNEALKKANAVFNIDEIEQIMDETREGVEKQKVSIDPNIKYLHF